MQGLKSTMRGAGTVSCHVDDMIRLHDLMIIVLQGCISDMMSLSLTDEIFTEHDGAPSPA